MDKELDDEKNLGNGESIYNNLNNLNILMEGRQGEPSQNRLKGDFGQDEKEKPTGSLKKGVREGRMTNKVKCVSWGVNRTLGFDSEVPTINIRWEKGIKVKLKKSRVWHSKIVNNKSKNIVMKFRNKIEYRVVKSNGKKGRTGAKAVNSRRVKETEIEKLDTDKYNGDHQKRDFSMFPGQVSGKKECEKVIAEVSKQSEVGDILVGCANINGWSEKELEVIGEVKKNRLDIVGLIETKIRAEQGDSWKNYFKDIKYECSGACREDGDKQGGGITVAWRKELDISIWKKERENEDRNWVEKERIWALNNNCSELVAWCFIYIACDHRDNEGWNDTLYEELYEDIIYMRSIGRKVVVMGDLNGWIGCGPDGISGGNAVKNGNGERILGMCNSLGFVIANKMPYAVGKWTWVRGKSKSILDYMLVDEALIQKLKSFVVDDGTRDIGSDHSWIIGRVKIGKRRRKKIRKRVATQKWKINSNTKWDKFTSRCDELFEEMSGGNEWRDGEEMYGAVVNNLIKAGEEVVGYMKPHKKRRKPLPVYVIDAIKGRKEARKALNDCYSRVQSAEEVWNVWCEFKRKKH